MSNGVLCTCYDCEKERANKKKHLEHPFYKEAHDYREKEREGQILKGAAKYPEPFNPDSWSPKELLSHAMQENIDQGHYIYGLYAKIEQLEKEKDAALDAAQYWQLRCNKYYKQMDQPNINFEDMPNELDIKGLQTPIKHSLQKEQGHGHDTNNK